MTFVSLWDLFYFQPMSKQHHYSLSMSWTGNRGSGTSGYRAYGREHTMSIDGKTDVLLSSDPAFQGDSTRYNPEELLLASLSSCHMLWYLHLCSDAGVIVTGYTDNPKGTMEESAAGGGRFIAVVLYPLVTVGDVSMIDKAIELHEQANEKCFIANSCNFPIRHQPKIVVEKFS